MKQKIFTLLFLLLPFFVYSQNHNEAIEGKVLSYFKHDSLKYRAAKFLLDNMDAHYSLYSKGIDSYYHKMDSVFSLPTQRYDFYKDMYVKASTENGDLENTAVIKWDKEAITAEFLISYIESAFKVWKQPWNSDVSFDLFCQYVLPYRITTEPISCWRNEYFDKYNNVFYDFMESQVNHTYKYGLYRALNSRLPNSLYYPQTFLPEFPLTIALKARLGNCETFAKRNVAQLRSIGLPSTLDFTPQWGNRSMGHSWAVLFVNDSISIPFGQNEELGTHFYYRPNHLLPKVYRHTYLKQKSMDEFCNDTISIVPEYLHDNCILDVTDKYTSVSNLSVRLKAPRFSKQSQWLYLCVFDNRDWIPVCYSKRNMNSAIFYKMGRGVVYLPTSIDASGNLIIEGNPIALDKDGVSTELKPDMQKRQIMRLTRKYPSNMKLKKYCQITIGGKFQVANREDFSDSLTIGVVNNTLENCFHYLPIKHKGKYKYFRYFAPNGSYGNMAEVKMFDSVDSIIGVKRCFGMKKDRGAYKKLFDGDNLSSFSVSSPDSAWAAVEFSQPVNIKKIGYLPRNDGNQVEKGDLYRLYYWWQGGWKVIDEKIAGVDGMLQFDNVPSDALYLLRDLTKGKQERIFTYKDGKQIWW